MTLVWRQAMGSLTTCLIRAFVAGLVLSLAPLAALAEGSTPRCDLGNYDPAQRPDPEGTPTEVGVGVYVLQVDRVDNVDQSFRLDTFIRLSWRDPRLAAVVAAAGVSSCRFPLADVWEPRIILFNRREADFLLSDVVSVDREGHARFLQRGQSTMRSPMDLRDFPIDRQVLPVTLISVEYAPESVTLQFDETAASREEAMRIPGWEIHEEVMSSGVLEAQVRDASAGGRRFARLDYEFHVSRELAYYTWRVVGPLTFIVLMSWAVFWIDPSNFGVQIGVASTTVLTLIAFLFSLNAILPTVSYLTRMDIFLFCSLGLALLAFGQAVQTAVLYARDRQALALRLDRWARWLFPILFGVLHLAFWTG